MERFDSDKIKPNSFSWIGLLLFIVSVIGSIFPGIPLFIIAQFYKKKEDYLKRMAMAIDQFWNVAIAPLLNKHLIIDDSMHPFGHRRETISHIIGDNYRHNNLTPLGERVRLFLHRIDPNHSIKASEDHEEH